MESLPGNPQCAALLLELAEAVARLSSVHVDDLMPIFEQEWDLSSWIVGANVSLVLYFSCVLAVVHLLASLWKDPELVFPPPLLALFLSMCCSLVCFHSTVCACLQVACTDFICRRRLWWTP